MILCIVRDMESAHCHGFRRDKRTHFADAELVAWWPGCDVGGDSLRGREFSRVLQLEYVVLTRHDHELIRTRLRLQPATWVELAL